MSQLQEKTDLMELDKKRKAGQAMTEDEINRQLTRIESQEKAIRDPISGVKDPDDRDRQLADLASGRGLT